MATDLTADRVTESLAGRRVLVTGSTGFKGGWLALWLHRIGAHVVGVGLPPEERSFPASTALDHVVDTRIGDIRDARSFDAAVGGEDFDVVFHLAAQPLVRLSYADPVDTFRTNVVGTAVVLDAARRMPSLRAVIVVSSDKCYANREWVWPYRETDPMGGHDPYSASKGCTELVAAAFGKSFFCNPDGPQLASVRAGNVIGGGDWSQDRLVPDLIRSSETHKPARIRNPQSVRPWQHVLEPVRGYLMLAAALLEDGPRHAGGWNFGPGPDADVDVATVAALVRRHWLGPGPEYVAEPVRNAPHESTLLRLDSTKARTQLGWKPVLGLEQAIDMTVAWYRMARHRPDRMLEFSREQIAHYCAQWSEQTSAERTNREASPNEELAACV